MAKAQGTCSIEGCDRPHYAHGWCGMHWKRWRKHGDPLKVLRIRHSGTAEERFWQKVDQRSADDCWPWTAGCGHRGYGKFNLDLDGRGKMPRLAHRLAWLYTFGSIPAGSCVLHHCDNPPCCNPAHLWLGTRADNNADMAQKGRSAQRGEGNAHAKLTEDAVREIRALGEAGATYQELMIRYEVSRQTIQRVLRWTHWQHVT